MDSTASDDKFPESQISQCVPKDNDKLSACVPDKDQPRGDVELFEQLFEAWKSQEGKSEWKGKDAVNQLELIERSHQIAQMRVSDLEQTVELLQTSVHSLHSDLNLLDDVSKDNVKLKVQLVEAQDELKEAEAKFVKQLEDRDLKIDQLLVSHGAELDELRMELEGELTLREQKMTEVVKENQVEIKKLEKEHKTEIAKLTMEYENKLAKLQRQKTVAAVTQQQSSNQEIFRRKLQHLKREYEQEVRSLKETVRQLQNQLTAQNSREATNNKASFSASSSKKMR